MQMVDKLHLYTGKACHHPKLSTFYMSKSVLQSDWVHTNLCATIQKYIRTYVMRPNLFSTGQSPNSKSKARMGLGYMRLTSTAHLYESSFYETTNKITQGWIVRILSFSFSIFFCSWCSSWSVLRNFFFSLANFVSAFSFSAPARARSSISCFTLCLSSGQRSFSEARRPNQINKPSLNFPVVVVVVVVHKLSTVQCKTWWLFL